MNQYLSKSKNIIVGILLVITQVSFGQDLEYENYTWFSNIDSLKKIIKEEDKKEPQIILKESKVYEFAYDKTNNLFEYYITHKIIRVNNDDGIELNNKLYLPYSSTSEVLKHKARVISPNGKITEMKESDVQEAIDEEENRKYKYYALEGVEVGSIIEYFYQLKFYPSYTGQRLLFQSETPKRNVSIEIISPAHLHFLAKSYNGFPDLELDTTYKDKNVLKAGMDVIPLQKEEVMAAYTSNLMQTIFKLHKNTYTRKTDLISYGTISSSVYEMIYKNVTKKNVKSIKKMLKKIDGLKEAQTEEQKIRLIEDYVKSKYFIVEQAFEGSQDIDAIINTGRCSEAGMTKLLVNAYKSIELRMEIVLACSRYDYHFDKTYEAYNFLDNYLIYFPKLDKYVEPKGLFSRLGYIDPSFSNNEALYIKEVTLGDFNTGVGKVKPINPIASDKSTDNLDLDVNFNIEDFNIEIDLERELTGYYAQNYQPIYDFIKKEDDEKDINESLVKYIAEDAEINNQTIDNKGAADFGIKPLVTKAKFTTENFVEKVGGKYLFKIGLLIGPQMEMYQEEERTLPIMNEYNREYQRKINFTIPEGYKVTNTDALAMEYKDSNDQAGFVSTYKVNGNVLEVTIHEYYKQIAYPIEEYENFRKVINAAADFNKAVVYLEKI